MATVIVSDVCKGVAPCVQHPEDGDPRHESKGGAEMSPALIGDIVERSLALIAFAFARFEILMIEPPEIGRSYEIRTYKRLNSPAIGLS